MRMKNDSLKIPYPRRRVVRWMLKNSIIAGFAALFDLEVIGSENIPQKGPLVVVGNHFHFLDPAAIIRILPYPAEFLGGLRMPNAPVWSKLATDPWGVLHVRRGASSRDALVSAQSVLAQEGVLCVFPEGGSWASVLRPPRPGAALLAARSNAPILPVGLDGLTDVFPLARKGKRAHVTIRIGKPFGPFHFSARDRSYRQQMDELGHDMMRRISQLIPATRRGFYSEDPAIREAAKGTEIYPWDNVIEE
jgi:1-acyl-sn-glycerol-3-phosphate acyltransferase